MSGILIEYLKRNLSPVQLWNEMQDLIKKYNHETGRTLFVYSSDTSKARLNHPAVDVQLNMDDYHTIQDLLKGVDNTKLDFYIETPGGSGEAAEEIARFLHSKFDEISFVIAGEAKSAGTILVLSGDEIYMSESGSLGPIDAQVRVGRTVVSAYNYIKWLEDKRAEAQKGRLNPVDLTIIAQVSPGEIGQVEQALDFAKKLVIGWLPVRKFRNWTFTRDRKIPVTQDMKEARAADLAKKLCNQDLWKTHGRSLKIKDVEEHLEIHRIENNPVIAEIIGRLKVVIRLLFDSSGSYKLFFLEDIKLTRDISLSGSPMPGGGHPFHQSNPVTREMLQPQTVPNPFEVRVKCPSCEEKYRVSAFIKGMKVNQPDIPNNANELINAQEHLECARCRNIIDLKPMKNRLEGQIQKQITFKP